MELWTLGELAERVEAALADYPGQANGRIRAVPDQRAIRWYTTTGMVDRPAEMRGRTALYGRRHLLQLVAIKRRQSQGQTLAQIQSELAGATNQSLEPIAALPEPVAPTPLASGVPALAGSAAQPRARFWADHAPAASPADTAPCDAPHPTLPSPPAPDALLATSGALAPEATVVAAVRLAGGVTLVLEQGQVVPDLARLVDAAAPLLAELGRQGLLLQPSSGDES